MEHGPKPKLKSTDPPGFASKHREALKTKTWNQTNTNHLQQRSLINST